MCVAQWRSGDVVGLATGDRGFIPAAALSSATLDKLFTHIVQRL